MSSSPSSSSADRLGPEGLAAAVSEAAVLGEAVNRARDLQNRPGNDLTPTALGAYAKALEQELEGVSVEVEGRDAIIARGMGAFAAVAQGSEQEPALITIKYDGTGTGGSALRRSASSARRSRSTAAASR